MKMQFKGSDKDQKKTGVRININLKKYQYKFLKQISEKKYLSLSEVVRQIIDEVIKDYDVVNNKKE